MSPLMGVHNLFNFLAFFNVGINILIATFLVKSVLSVDSRYETCKPKNCDTGPNISYPFFIYNAGVDYCGYPGFTIVCEKGRPTYITSLSQYIIKDISYENQSFRVVNEEITSSTSCYGPLENFTWDRSSLQFSPHHADLFFFYNCTDSFSVNSTNSSISCDSSPMKNSSVVLLPGNYEEWNWTTNGSCESSVHAPVELEEGGLNLTIKDVDYTKLLKDGFTLKWIGLYDCVRCQKSGGRCGFENGTSVCFCPDGCHLKDCNDEYLPPKNFNSTRCSDCNIYYSLSNDTWPSLQPQCSVIELPVDWTHTYDDLFTLLTATFSLEMLASSDCHDCHITGGQCQNNGGNFQCSVAKVAGDSKSGLKLGVGVSGAVMAIIVVLCCIWRFLPSNKSMVSRKKNSRKYADVEAFIRNFGFLTPKRYSYSSIKKITNSFQDKLGQGGFGSVYKGKLQDGKVVAVKVLNNPKSNGQEFINEVASISRTSHVNIVALSGFCFEGSKRALVYEFMPNGSLEKFIYNNNSSISDHQLGWKSLFQISLGIARGLEYLHRGCKTRIVHFDIKPHNILLDEDFCPKISDFGLSKLCPGKDSIISMTGARGTPGYIAPEVFCRNFGEVSHKSDVYSYGMMVLEMVGGRKNIDVGVDRTSEIYFPHWIYKRLELHDELGLQGIANEEDKEFARKMIIVSLCCIQTDPSSRPPISEVVDMLEGSLESLPIPPKPFLSSPSRSPADSSTTNGITTL